jgi:outer membrane protein OmpA-like peptidoglycan-associated protein
MFQRTCVALAAAAVLLTGCTTTAVAPPTAPPAAAVSPTVVLPIAQTPRGVEFTLPDSVLFASGRSDMNNSLAAPYLDRIATLLKTKSDKRVLVEGHTDATGAVELNQRLSKERAAAVANALSERGVPRERIDQAGLAATRPVAPNDVESGRRLNRRSEVVLLGETIEAITRGEPQNSFEDAAARVRAALEQGAKK